MLLGCARDVCLEGSRRPLSGSSKAADVAMPLPREGEHMRTERGMESVEMWDITHPLPPGPGVSEILEVEV